MMDLERGETDTEAEQKRPSRCDGCRMMRRVSFRGNSSEEFHRQSCATWQTREFLEEGSGYEAPRKKASPKQA